jgi:hypothetical protein
MALPSTTIDTTYGSDSDEESPTTYVVENVHCCRYMEVHFYFECLVSDNLYVQIRKCSTDNPPKSLAPHNYFEKETQKHHMYKGLDPAVLRDLSPGNHNTPYFKVIDMGPDFNQYGIIHLHFDEEKNRLQIFDVNDGETIEVEGNSRKLTFTVKALFKGA